MRSFPFRTSLPVSKTSSQKLVSRHSSRGLRVAKLFASVFVLLGCSGLAMAQSDPTSPSVDSVLDRFVQSLGGRAALESVTSMVFAGDLTIPELKATGKTTEYFKYPDHFALSPKSLATVQYEPCMTVKRLGTSIPKPR